MKTVNSQLNQSVTTVEYEKKLQGLLETSENWMDKTKKSSHSKLRSSLNKNESLEYNENIAAEAKFLAMLQTDTPQEVAINMKNPGTIQRGKSLKGEREKSVSTFKIEFKDIGEAEIMVSQIGESYSVVIDVQDKSKIPANPLLFKKIVEDQLSSNLGVSFKLQVR